MFTAGVDTTIEAMYLSRADVVSAWCASRAWWRPTLRLHFQGMDARPRTLDVPDAALADAPRRVAEYVNELKARNAALGTAGAAALY